VPPEILANGEQIVEVKRRFTMHCQKRSFRCFRDLQKSFVGDFFFAHAGVKPKVQLSRQKESDLLWIRGRVPVVKPSNDDFGKIIIHEHTPTREIEVGPNRINIDTGAFATGRYPFRRSQQSISTLPNRSPGSRG
jgi:serine/threonine protein phosphatase 1